MTVRTPNKLNENALIGVAKQFKVLSEVNRLRLLNCLRRGECSVSELVKETGLNQANASKQLRILWKRGILSRERRGQNVYYKIGDPKIFELCELMCDFGDHSRA